MKSKQKALILVMCAAFLVAASVFGTFAYLTDTEAVTNTFTVGQVGLSLNEAKVNEMGQVLDVKGTTVAWYEDGKLHGSISAGERWTPTKHPTDSTLDDLAQEYHLLPGHTYIKDPTVTVDKGSEAAYVRMMVTITFKAEADAVFAKYDDEEDGSMDEWLNISDDWRGNGIPKTEKTYDDKNNPITISRTYEFRYLGNDEETPRNGIVVKSASSTSLPALFTTLTVPGEVTNSELANLAGMEISVVAHAIQAAGFADADAAWTSFDTQNSSDS